MNELSKRIYRTYVDSDSFHLFEFKVFYSYPVYKVVVYCQYWVWYLPWVTCSLLWATGNTTNRLTMHNSEQQIIYFWAVFHGNAFSGRTKTINFTVSTCNHFPNKWQFCYKDIYVLWNFEQIWNFVIFTGLKILKSLC